MHGLNFASMSHMGSATQIDEWSTSVHSSGWGGNALIYDPLFKLIVLKQKNVWFNANSHTLLYKVICNQTFEVVTVPQTFSKDLPSSFLTSQRVAYLSEFFSLFDQDSKSPLEQPLCPLSTCRNRNPFQLAVRNTGVHRNAVPLPLQVCGHWSARKHTVLLGHQTWAVSIHSPLPMVCLDPTDLHWLWQLPYCLPDPDCYKIYKYESYIKSLTEKFNRTATEVSGEIQNNTFSHQQMWA